MLVLVADAKFVNNMLKSTVYEFAKYASTIAGNSTYMFRGNMSECKCGLLFSYRLCSCPDYAVFQLASAYNYRNTNQLMQLVGNKYLIPDYQNNTVQICNLC